MKLICNFCIKVTIRRIYQFQSKRESVSEEESESGNDTDLQCLFSGENLFAYFKVEEKVKINLVRVCLIKA